MNLNDVQPTLPTLGEEVQQVLLGTVRAASQDIRAAEHIESITGVTRQEWKDAARALLMSRKTAVLKTLSLASLEAVAFGHIDLRGVLHRVMDVAEEHAAEKRIRDIASRRLNMDLDEQGSALHSLETGLLHDALMEAFISGQNTRSA